MAKQLYGDISAVVFQVRELLSNEIKQSFCRDIALDGHATGPMNIFIFRRLSKQHTRGGSRVRTINNPFEFTES